jgi:hypothetical protein
VVAQLNPVIYLMWLLSIFTESVLLAFLVCRPNAHPAFRGYVGFCVLRSLLLFWASFGWPWTYWYGYWIGSIVEGLILLAVVTELALRVFRRLRVIPVKVLIPFCALSAVVLVLSIGASLRTPDAPMRIMAIGRAIERTVNLVLFCGLALIIALADYLGLRWRRHAYGIAVGLAVNLSLSTVAQVVYSPFLMGPAAVLRYFQMAGFFIAETVWIQYLRKPEPEVSPVSESELNEVNGMFRDFLGVQRLLKAKHEVIDCKRNT